jgi:hypothetical protein
VVAIHQTGIYHAKAWAIALAAMAMFVGPKVKAGTSEDEKQIRALQDLFAKGIMTKAAKLRASIFAVDASLVPATGGFFRGPEAMEKDFEQESASITDQTKRASPAIGSGLSHATRRSWMPTSRSITFLAQTGSRYPWRKSV